MSDYMTAPVRLLKAKNSTFAYRLFGNQKQEDAVPLLLPTHFRSRLDFWDPALINGLAAQRMILLLDNHGSADPETIKGSNRTSKVHRQQQSKSPSAAISFQFWAREIISFIVALGYKQVDLLGFSMGGFISQMIALEAPSMVRKLVLAGTAPSQGPGVVSGNMDYFQNLMNAVTDGDIKAGFLAGFFGLSEERQRCGEKWWHRITSTSSMWPFVTTNDIDGQITAMLRWYGTGHRDEGSYDRLAELKCPILIVCGQQDNLVPEGNSILLWQKISQTNPDVQIHIYPQSGHGFLFEFHVHCARLVNDFLNKEVQAQCTCQYCEF